MTALEPTAAQLARLADFPDDPADTPGTPTLPLRGDAVYAQVLSDTRMLQAPGVADMLMAAAAFHSEGPTPQTMMDWIYGAAALLDRAVIFAYLGDAPLGFAVVRAAVLEDWNPRPRLECLFSGPMPHEPETRSRLLEAVDSWASRAGIDPTELIGRAEVYGP